MRFGCRSGSSEWLDLLERIEQSIALHLEVVTPLKVHPESFRGSEIAGHSKGRVGGDPTLAVHDLVDSPRRDADGHSQSVLGNAEWLEILDQKHLTWMDWSHERGSVHQVVLSVVVDDLNVLRTCCGPSEADPPLLVDPDAVVAGSITLQLLQSIARRDSQVVDGIRCIEDEEFSQGSPLRVFVEPANSLSLPNSFGVLVSE
jgi:hypothetical protein